MSINNIFLLIFLSVLMVNETWAFDDCFEETGAKYGISPYLLKAIAMTESSMNPRAENTKTKDRGLMQINPWWFPKLQTLGIDAESLWDPCVSIEAGSWILSQEIARYGYSWTAVGAYHAGAYTNRTLSRKEKKYIEYSRKVKKNLYKLGI